MKARPLGRSLYALHNSTYWMLLKGALLSHDQSEWIHLYADGQLGICHMHNIKLQHATGTTCSKQPEQPELRP